MPINVTLLAVVARVTTPIVLCASGGLYCQMAGTPNITLEGAMLMAAFTGVAGSYYTGSALAGLLCAIAGSMEIGRASCSERVCRCVVGTVGGGGL